MKVHNNTGVQQAEGANRTDRFREVSKRQLRGKTDQASQSAERSAEISSRAREMNQAKQVASRTPGERKELIAELRRRIEAGEYNVSPDKVADRMVREHRETSDLG